MGYFRSSRGGITISLDPVETAVLGQVISEMAELIGPPSERTGGQDWLRELGFTGLDGLGQAGEALSEPDDPIQARLFPAAYRDDDDVDGAAHDFRRFTEDDLRAGKAANAVALLATLPEGGGTIMLDDDACSAWLGGLNDARLALGTALDVDQNTEYELAVLESNEPRAQRLLVYHWLGELQSSLLEALMAGDPY